MTETEALRMMVEILFCAGDDYDESVKVVDWYTKTEEGKAKLKKNYEEFCKNHTNSV